MRNRITTFVAITAVTAAGIGLGFVNHDGSASAEGATHRGHHRHVSSQSIPDTDTTASATSTPSASASATSQPAAAAGSAATDTLAPAATTTASGAASAAASSAAGAAGAASTAADAAAAAPAATSSSSMPTGDVTSNGRTWHQSYAEDFDTDAALGSFTSKYPDIGVYDGNSDTGGQGIYAPDEVLSVSNGNLDYWLHSENGQPLGATILPDNWAPHQTARVSVRYKTTDTPGYKFVGMLWPSDNDWSEGEIDWPESDLGGTPRPASAIPGTSVNGSTPTFLPEDEQFTSTDTTSYHTATTEWDHGEVRWYWDGVEVASTTEAVPSDPMRVTLQAETWLNQGAVPRGADGHVDVDWISIWD